MHSLSRSLTLPGAPPGWRPTFAPEIPEWPRGEDHTLHRRPLVLESDPNAATVHAGYQSGRLLEPRGARGLCLPNFSADGSRRQGSSSSSSSPRRVAALQARRAELAQQLQDANDRLEGLRTRAASSGHSMPGAFSSQDRIAVLTQETSEANACLTHCKACLENLESRERLLQAEEAQPMRDGALVPSPARRSALAEEIMVRNNGLRRCVQELEDECALLRLECKEAHEDTANRVEEMQRSMMEELSLTDRQLALCEHEVAGYGQSGEELRDECRRDTDNLRDELNAAEEAAWAQAVEAERWEQEAAEVQRSVEEQRSQLLAQLDTVRKRLLNHQGEQHALEVEDREARQHLRMAEKRAQENRRRVETAHDDLAHLKSESKYVLGEKAELEERHREAEEHWQSVSQEGALRVVKLEHEAQQLRHVIRANELGVDQHSRLSSEAATLADQHRGMERERRELAELDSHTAVAHEGLSRALEEMQEHARELQLWRKRFETGAEAELEGGASPQLPFQEELQQSKQELEVLQEHAFQCQAEAVAAETVVAATMNDLRILLYEKPDEVRMLHSNVESPALDGPDRERCLEMEVQIVSGQLEIAQAEQARVQQDLKVAMERLSRQAPSSVDTQLARHNGDGGSRHRGPAAHIV